MLINEIVKLQRRRKVTINTSINLLKHKILIAHENIPNFSYTLLLGMKYYGELKITVE